MDFYVGFVCGKWYVLGIIEYFYGGCYLIISIIVWFVEDEIGVLV